MGEPTPKALGNCCCPMSCRGRGTTWRWEYSGVWTPWLQDPPCGTSLHPAVPAPCLNEALFPLAPPGGHRWSSPVRIC